MAKRSFVCKLGRCLAALPSTSGHLSTGSCLTTETPTLGGCGAVLIDVPGATPSQLALALGKDGNAYLLNRNNLGGITPPVASTNVASSVRGTIGCHLSTPLREHILFFVTEAAPFPLIRLLRRLRPASLPAWSVSQTGQGSPWVTTTNGTTNAIVWIVGCRRATSACTATMAIPAQ